MKIVTVPMHDDLAVMGRCCGCHQGFDKDSYYCQVAMDDMDTRTVQVWLTCLGCAAQLACT